MNDLAAKRDRQREAFFKKWREVDGRSMEDMLRTVEPDRLRKDYCPHCEAVIPFVKVKLYIGQWTWRPIGHYAPCGWACANGHNYYGGAQKFRHETPEIHRHDNWCEKCTERCEDCDGFHWKDVTEKMAEEIEWLSKEDELVCKACYEIAKSDYDQKAKEEQEKQERIQKKQEALKRKAEREKKQAKMKAVGKKLVWNKRKIGQG